MTWPQIFISYAGHDAFEAGLLQFAIETLLGEHHVKAWTYQRDQQQSEKQIAAALKRSIRNSVACLILVSPSTIDAGASQWMELAYADAFDIEIFILLHHLSFAELKRFETGVPPLLLASQCNPASHWRDIVEDLRNVVTRAGLA